MAHSERIPPDAMNASLERVRAFCSPVHLRKIRALLILFMAAILSPGFFWPQPDEEETTEARIERVLAQFEQQVAQLDLDAWIEEIDALQEFTVKMADFGGNLVTFFTLDQMETLWPAWKEMSRYLEILALEATIIKTTESLMAGQVNKATMIALDSYVRSKASRFLGSTTMAGIGLIEFALNEFGEASIRVAGENFYRAYRNFHLRRHPDAESWMRVFARCAESGNLEALVNELDTFWSDPVVDGLRGFYVMQTANRNYRETMRRRLIREEVAPLIRADGERRRFEAQLAAKQRLRDYEEELARTQVVLVFPVMERGLGQRVREYEAALYVDGREEAVDRVRVTFEGAALTIPLRLLRKNLQVTVVLRQLDFPQALIGREISPEGREYFQEHQRRIDLSRPPGGSQFSAERGRIHIHFSEPLWVGSTYEVPVEVSGDASKIRGVSLTSAPQAGDITGNPLTPGRTERFATGFQDGRATFYLPGGYYWMRGEGLRTRGPLTIYRNAGLVAEALGPGSPTPQAPDLGALQAAYRQAEAALREAETPLREIALAFHEARNAAIGEIERALESFREARAALYEEHRERINAGNLTREDAQAMTAAFQQRQNEISAREQESTAAFRMVREDGDRSLAALWEERHREFENLQLRFEEAMRDLDSARHDANSHFYVLENDEARLSQSVRWHAFRQEDAETQVATLVESMRDHALELARMESALDAKFQTLEAAYAQLRPWLEWRGDPLPDVWMQARQREARYVHRRLHRWIEADLPGFGERVQAWVRDGMEDMEKARTASESLLDEMQAAAGALPPIDMATWALRVREFKTRYDSLVANLLAGRDATGDGGFTSLRNEMQFFFAEQAPIIGDLLPAEERTITPFERYQKIFQPDRIALIAETADSARLGPIMQAAMPALQARMIAVFPAARIYRDVQGVLGLGPTNEARTQALQRMEAQLQAQTVDLSGDPEAVLQRFAEAHPIVEMLPDGLGLAIREAWESACRTLIAEEIPHRYAADRGSPLPIVASFDGQPVNHPFHWRDRKAGADSGFAAGVAMIAITGPDSEAVTMEQSHDGGETWMECPRLPNGHFMVRTPAATALYPLQVRYHGPPVANWSFLPLVQ